VEILKLESSGAAKTERERCSDLCWTDERNAISELMIFNNEQVTCVGARVMGKAMIDRERPCPNFLFIKLIGSKVQLSAKTIRWTISG
jgi:hypothetical protein